MTQSTTADPFVQEFLDLSRKHKGRDVPKMTLELAVGLHLGAGKTRDQVLAAVSETITQYEKAMKAKETKTP